jgi:hypothetical protein
MNKIMKPKYLCIGAYPVLNEFACFTYYKVIFTNIKPANQSEHG